MPPKVLICGKIHWANKELHELLGNIADIVYADAPNREVFFQEFSPGGKYEGTVAMYHSTEANTQLGPHNKEFIDALPSTVKWIGHKGAGYDDVDVIACKARGINVSNTPFSVDEGTATTALYLLIATLRNFTWSESSLRAGNWKPKEVEGASFDLSTRTLAIIGLGGIGIRFAEMVRPFRMRVIYHNRRENPDAPEWCEYFKDRDEMLRQADVLSVHVPLSKETEHLVDDKMIRTMRKGAIIINTARGKVIDEDAMIKALEDGHLAAIGLDVYPDEPKVNPRLLEFRTATLLPHVGTENQDSRRAMEVRVLTNIRDYLTKGMGENLVPECRIDTPVSRPHIRSLL